MQKKKPGVRLSKSVIPIEYDIKLNPDLENFTFGGVETITLNLQKASNSITLHSKDIDIETASFLIKKEKIFSDKISYNQKAETVTFLFKKSIPKGKHKLTITFKGILKDNLRGFYKSSYIYDGKVHNIATTQFEATDARRAFPCFDEPAQKAVFHVSLVVPKGKTAISNTLPISKVEHEAGFEVVKFAPSPKMSTYLLAFIVGDFEYLEKKSKRGVTVRVYTTPGKKHQAKFSLDVTVKVLDFYEEYFAIPYPLETLDMIAIPDFSSLAMENWGAITFREIGLLVDPLNTSTASKEMIAEVIAHELAHQWFGNLVTMEWWTHLWLNEGFASYIPYVVINKLFPEWRMWERFMVRTLSYSLKLDSLLHTHPIEITVHHPDEIGEIFDAVSYEKGASIIRMLADYLGEENFRDGLRYYLKKHSYKNTETVHLWEAFEKVSKKPVRKMMQNWTAKGGFPLVSANIAKNQIKLSQERFFSSAISKAKSQDKTIWQIPISILDKNKKVDTFLSTKSTTLPYIGDRWLKINANESSFFQTKYSKELLEKLKIPIADKLLSPIDRLGIIRDLFALAEAGYIPTTDVLDFLKSYQNEDEYIVWVEISNGLSRIESLITGTKNELAFDRFTINLYQGIFQKLGWDKKSEEKHTDSLLRAMVISKLGRAEYKTIIKEARKRFNSLSTKNPLDPDLKAVIYRIVAMWGTQKDYKVFIAKYKTETLHEEKNRIGSVLGEFRDDKILCKVLEFALSKDVRAQDTPNMISIVAMNERGRDVWFKFIKYRWDILLTRYGDGGYTLSRILKAISNASDKKHLELCKRFIKTHKTPGAKRAVEQVLERIENNVLWKKRDAPSLSKYLQK